MSHSKTIPWWMWGISTSFFAYQFVLRVSPGVLMHDIMHKFHIDASAFGMLTAFYYLGYAGMQIPVGMMLDRYHPRNVITACIALCTLGTLSFVFAHHWIFALVGRFCIGAGSAAGFLGTCTILRLWFKTEQYSYMVGFTVTIGLIGALCGGVPVSYMTSLFGWENTLLGLGAIGCIMAILVLIFMNSPIPIQETKKEKALSVGAQLCSFIKSPTIIFLGLSSGLMVGVLQGFADVWGVPYLETIYGFAPKESASLASLVYLGLAVGGPLLAFIAEKYRCHIGLTTASGFGMAAIMGILLTNDSLHFVICSILIFTSGVLSGYQVLILTVVSRMVAGSMVGLTTALANSLNVLFGFVFLAATGFLMDHYWQGLTTEEGLRVYDGSAYTIALSIIPFASIIGAIWVWSMRGKVQSMISNA